MIAVTFALPAESNDFVSLLQNKRHARAGESNIIRGEIGTRSVTIVHTGVGQRTCEARMKDFLSREHPRFLISSGFAGGINTEMNAGDLFLAENFSDPQLFQTAQRVVGDQPIAALANCLRLHRSSIRATTKIRNCEDAPCGCHRYGNRNDLARVPRTWRPDAFAAGN